MEAAPSATSRHTRQPLPLLPSGPGGVCSLALREDRQGHHKYDHSVNYRANRLNFKHLA